MDQGQRLNFIPLGGNMYHLQFSAAGYHSGYVHRRQTWTGQRIVTWPFDGPGSRWEITCIKNCR